MLSTLRQEEKRIVLKRALEQKLQEDVSLGSVAVGGAVEVMSRGSWSMSSLQRRRFGQEKQLKPSSKELQMAREEQRKALAEALRDRVDEWPAEEALVRPAVADFARGEGRFERKLMSSAGFSRSQARVGDSFRLL